MRFAASVSLALTLALSGSAGAQLAPHTDLTGLPFPGNFPDKDAAARLRDELFFQRATQVYLWALPAVSMMAMKEGSERAFGAGYNVLPVWKKRLDARTIVTTPNCDVIYAMGYIDVGKEGPLVIEVPPQQQGILDDFWQRPIAGPTVAGKAYAGDVGLAGPDRGKGGKFLVLPPGHRGKAPEGYFTYRSRTNNVFVLWRAFFTDPADLGPPVRQIEQTRIYPLGRPAEARPMRFPDASGVSVNMDFPTDSRFYEMLSRFIDSEVVDPMDADWRGMLAGIGIVKGQPWKPDPSARAILDAAAKTAFLMARARIYEDLEKQPGGRIYDDRHYVDPLRGGAVDFEWLDRSGSFRDLDLRAAGYSILYATSPAMASQTPGQGARHLTAFKDADGDFLNGDHSYRLHLPPKVPAANFWSVTLYDALTASALSNGYPFPSIGSRDKPAANADGSMDLYFTQEPPPGKEANWRRVVPSKGFFIILRLYGPTEAYYDRTWKPDDVVKLK